MDLSCHIRNLDHLDRLGDVPDNLMRFDIHEVADRAGVGALLTLVTRRNIDASFALDFIKEVISTVTDNLPFSIVMAGNRFIFAWCVIFFQRHVLFQVVFQIL